MNARRAASSGAYRRAPGRGFRPCKIRNMTEATDAVSLIFKINNNLVEAALKGLSDHDMWQRPQGTGNPIGWILGHVTSTRTQLLARLGAPFDTGWGKVFA